MNTTTIETTENLIVELRRSFPVSRERLFSAWTDPTEVRLWFGPEGATVSNVQMDVRPGGKYAVTASCSGDPCTAIGEYREVAPPSRLVYTWTWENDPDWVGVESVITVEFNEQPGGCELHLTHKGFPTAEHSGRHEYGWSGTLDKLARRFQS